jgi:2-succinyl-5-enolpyruvyl-6-hydroxy-3-cyclohexene-1-carboxylate synthase
VLLGDLAFLHDLGSLATLGAQADGPAMVVVVLDNQGGGLFDHLPIADHPTAHEPHFVTPPRADIAGLSQAIPGEFVAATDAEGLRDALDAAFSRPGLTIVHAPFDREVDLARHRATWALGVAACEGLNG